MNDLSFMYIPFLPLAGFIFNGSVALLKSRGQETFGRSVTSLVACLTPLMAFVLALKAFFTLSTNPTLASLDAPFLMSWMPLETLSLGFGFTVDHLSSVMLLVVTGVGFLIHLYSTGYMIEDPAYARYMAYLNLFLFFMLTLILADSLPLLFVGWEGVGLCSYLLIGFWFDDPEKAKAGKKAFVVNRVGDFAFLIGMFLIVAIFNQETASDETMARNFLDFSFIRANAELLAPMATAIVLCLFAGATGKSAQIPLYVWLPDAMAGPTPVSALIHAATMVTAGIYLMARLSFLVVMSPIAMTVIVSIGLATALVAALIAVTQHDIKKVLAYSTVSQLGYMVAALGVGAFSAAIFHVVTHAFFKACLFLGAGSVIHALHHEQDVRHMGGLFSRMKITGTTFLISTLAIAGFPPLSGFFSKDEILYMIYANAPHPVFYAMAFMTAGLTAFYMMRVFALTFLGKTRYHHPEKIHESPWVMTLPLVILAALAAVAGLVGLPHVLGHNYFADWLAFLGQKTPHHIEGSVLQESHLMALSAGWGVFWMAISWFVYTRAPHWADAFSAKLGPLYRLACNKFRIDEIYECTIVKPLKFVSDAVLFKFVDSGIIDGLLVNGTADTSKFLARTFSSAHTGMIGHYIFYFLLGILMILGFLTVS